MPNIQTVIDVTSENMEQIPTPVPWYSDSYTYVSESAERIDASEYLKLRPQDIFRLLTKHVIGQDEACKSVAIMMYQHLRGHRSVNMLAGPTGAGKSFITETLRDIFPDIVIIRDISSLTCDGFSGYLKVPTLFQGLSTYVGDNKFGHLMVLDEADKCFAFKSSARGGSPSEDVQSELLGVIHGAEITCDKDGTKTVDTSKMSFLFAGSFDRQAKTIAEDRSGGFGFGQKIEKAEEYDKPITMEDVHTSGCIRELCGRIENIFPLYPISTDTFRNILNDRKSGPLYELESEFGIRFKITDTAKDEISHEAIKSKLGIRYIKKTLRAYVDNAIWEEANPKVIEIG